MEQVFFNVPLSKLELVFKKWIKESLSELPIPETNKPENKWFDIGSLCDYLPEKPSKATIYAKTSKGEIPHYKDGKHLRFLQSEIDEWLKSGKIKTNTEIEKEAQESLLKVGKKGGSSHA